jgi:nitroreductase
MDFTDCITQRQSCRAFLPEPVSKETIEKVLQSANRSPSYMNSQPWEVMVATADKLDAIRQALHNKALQQEKPTPDLPFPATWPDAAARRVEDHRRRRLKTLGVDLDDKDRIRSQFLSNFVFFNAPCALFLGIDKTLTTWSVFDLGLFTHGLLLSAHAAGLGACPQAVPLSYPGIVRKELAVAEDLQLILAVSLGYPDDTATVNRYRSQRREPTDFTRWYGFE